MENSAFFQNAVKLINEETKKLESFCNELDKDPIAKKNNIAEYKCAKYRYAGATAVWCMFFHSHRVASKNVQNHYLISQVNDIFVTIPEYMALYENAPDDEKRDYALYYGVLAFANAEIAKFEEKLAYASEWEKIELEERIGGLQFAKVCLDEAWQKRKDVIV
ncbi:MAG: hypothetical protein IJB94_07680 [Clostridia bacterium]|nr:hypothetical protein [Clostridia bacterium]